jgi:hypothetical protein
MKQFILFILICGISSSGTVLFAQDNYAFRVISVHGNVTLDGAPVSVDQKVPRSANRLTIDKDAQAAVLLPWGVVMNLGPGENDVTMLGDAKRWLATQGARHDGPAVQPSGGRLYLLGNVVSFWWTQPIDKPLKLSITNEFGDVYFDTLMQNRIVLRNFRRFFKQKENTLVQIRKDQQTYEAMMIMHIEDDHRKKLEHDLSQIENHPDKAILTIAILEAHKLDLDAAVLLLELGPQRDDLSPDLKNYIDYKKREF